MDTVSNGTGVVTGKGIGDTMHKSKRHVLITGGSGGIGAATAEAFAQAGYAVTFFYRTNAESAEVISSSLREKGYDVSSYRVDVRKSSDVREAVMKANLCYGVVDVLISNAGIASQKLITDVSEDEFREMFDIHVGGLFHLVQAVLPGMIARKTGTILTVSSIWGITGASCEVVYSSAKAAIIGFTKALAKEVGPSGITVNCVAPGVIDTQMNHSLTGEDLQGLCDETPLGRIGTPEEIAQVLLFLASDHASFITGQVISLI